MPVPACMLMLKADSSISSMTQLDNMLANGLRLAPGNMALEWDGNTANNPYACLRLSTASRWQSIYNIDIACMLRAAVNSDSATTKRISASAPAITSMVDTIQHSSQACSPVAAWLMLRALTAYLACSARSQGLETFKIWHNCHTTLICV